MVAPHCVQEPDGIPPGIPAVNQLVARRELITPDHGWATRSPLKQNKITKYGSVALPRIPYHNRQVEALQAVVPPRDKNLSIRLRRSFVRTLPPSGNPLYFKKLQLAERLTFGVLPDP